MEKRSNKTDKMTQGLIKEIGLHKPSERFTENVMNAVFQLESKKQTYRPLISKKGWLLLFLFTTTIIVVLSVFPINGLNILNGFDLFDKPLIQFSIPEFDISKETIYGIGFLSLFLLQIPILKKQLDKRTIV